MSKRKDSLLGALGVITALGNPGAEMDSFLTEWSSFFGTAASIDPDELSELQQTMSHYLSSPNRREELELVEAGSKNPLLGITLVLYALPTIAKREAQRIWDLIFAEQTADGGISAGWNIKELPAPKEKVGSVPGIKYLIVSDLHRDAASDDVGILEPGSIDHFTANANLYERILDFVKDEGYTLIEGGDCEELWFVRDAEDYERKNGRLDIAHKLQEIITSHSRDPNDPNAFPGVYDKLRELHGLNRYYRIYGNHDSFLKPDGNDDSVADVLRQYMGPNADGPFEIYDAFVIPGLKSMMEHTAGGIVEETLKLAANPNNSDTQAAFVANVLRGRLGMDSGDYSIDTRMLVTHGHHFDFWNCPENQILGLLIANSVGMFVDRNMDPFLDIRGIALQGNPYIDFADAFAGWPVFNSWVSHDPSVRFAHQVQHMPNLDRQLMDSIMFSETRAALIGTFGIALNHHPTPTTVITPQQSKADLCSGDITLTEYLRRHHLHHICIGHTHNPQSQPFATIQDLGAFGLPLAPVLALIRGVLPFEIHLKTTYFNSGTGGWMEGVIWAIEIDTSGQARLVYWTDNSVGPEYMDWELQPLATAVDTGLELGLEKALGVEVAGISTSVEVLRQQLKVRLEELAVSAADVGAALDTADIWPIHALAAALVPSPEPTEPDEADEQSNNRLYQLQEALPELIKEKLEVLKNQFERLRDFGYDAMLSAKRRALGCDDTATAPEILTLKAPISSSELERLQRYEKVLIEMGASPEEALHYGGVALSAFGQFPLSVPFFSTLLRPLDPMGLLEAVESPVLYGLLSTLWMYPPHPHAVELTGVRITSNFAVADGEVSLTVTIADAGPVTV